MFFLFFWDFIPGVGKLRCFRCFNVFYDWQRRGNHLNRLLEEFVPSGGDHSLEIGPRTVFGSADPHS